MFKFIHSEIELSSNVLTLTVLFLPLSAMWASTTVDNMAKEGPKLGFSGRKNLLGTFTSVSTDIEMKSSDSRKDSRYTASEDETAVEEKA